MAVAVFRSEEGGGAVLALNHHEPVVTAKSPSAARCEPLDAAAEVAREVGLRVRDTNILPTKHRKPANTSSCARNERSRGPDGAECPGVRNKVRRRQRAEDAGQLLLCPECGCRLAFNTEDA